MYDILKSIFHFIRPTRVTRIDNAAFQVHYRLTTMCLIACSIMVTLKQFFGDPISCFTAYEKDIPERVLNDFCWMHSTFTLPGSLAKKLGVEVIAPGVEKHIASQNKTYHKYYQWVCFFLFFEAGVFYIPHLIWKICEGSRIEKLTVGMENPVVIVDSKARLIQDSRIKQLASYFVESLGGHTAYAWQYFVCEWLNLINVLGNIFFLNMFLGYQFTSYGTEVINYAKLDVKTASVDPMIRVFPRITKCTFFKFGPSGNLEDRDALCVLPLNIINEKIFIFLWFWFILLALISSLAVAYRLFWIFFRSFRQQLFVRFNKRAGRHYLERMSHKFGIGDWFMIMLISKNMHSLNFREFIDEMGKIVDGVEVDGKLPLHPSAPNLHA
ncbi:hypothetical protein CHUAL_009926 [Chamberlinius hualienensis]